MLPLGSIVRLKKGERLLMIISRGALLPDKTSETIYCFDYVGCLYPTGIDVENSFYFNHEDIDKVIFYGYSDKQEHLFVEQYEQWRKETQSIYACGKVTQSYQTNV